MQSHRHVCMLRLFPLLWQRAATVLRVSVSHAALWYPSRTTVLRCWIMRGGAWKQHLIFWDRSDDDDNINITAIIIIIITIIIIIIIIIIICRPLSSYIKVLTRCGVHYNNSTAINNNWLIINGGHNILILQHFWLLITTPLPFLLLKWWTYYQNQLQHGEFWFFHELLYKRCCSFFCCCIDAWLLLLMQGMRSANVFCCPSWKFSNKFCCYDFSWQAFTHQFSKLLFSFFLTYEKSYLFFDAAHEYSIPSPASLQWHFGVQSMMTPIILP